MTIKKHSVVLYFILSYSISWVVWLPLYLPTFGIDFLPILPFHHALGAFGTILAAFIITRLEKGKAGVKDLIKRMLKWKVNPVWYGIALLCPFYFLELQF